MNYVSAILGIFCIWTVGDWFVRARKTFIIREVEDEIARAQ